jgi:flagellar basal-body rod modification protein FlgD
VLALLEADRRQDMSGIESILPGTTAANAAGSSNPTNKVQDQKNQFLQLLVAQLKGQNPLDPLDGTQFVSQLAQFSSLEELTSIHAVLKNVQEYLKPSAQQKSSDPNQIF